MAAITHQYLDRVPKVQHAPKRNIAEILEMEQQAVAGRTRSERVADLVAYFAGRMWFVVAHAVWFGAWIILNSALVPHRLVFDPYPYQFLTLVVSLEAIFLSLFIMMSQNRSSKQADARSQLDLQINLLAEQEATKMLQMLQSICEHHKLPIAHDPEVDALKSPTSPAELVEELKARMPETC